MNKKSIDYRSILSRLWRYIRPYKWKLILSIISALISSVLTLFFPLLTGKAVDGIIDGDTGLFFRILMMMVLSVGLSAVFQYLMTRTAMGRKLYAIGGNETASRVAGIRVNAYKTIAFTISGAMAGFAGVLLASRIGSASPTGGDAYMLNSYATIFIGKTLFREGIPNVLGTVVGVALFTILANGLTIMQVPTFVQNIVTGVIIVFAVVFQKMGSGRND